MKKSYLMLILSCKSSNMTKSANVAQKSASTHSDTECPLEGKTLKNQIHPVKK